MTLPTPAFYPNNLLKIILRTNFMMPTQIIIKKETRLITKQTSLVLLFRFTRTSYKQIDIKNRLTSSTSIEPNRSKLDRVQNMFAFKT